MAPGAPAANHKKRARGGDDDDAEKKSPHAHAHDDNDAAAAAASIKNKKTKLRESDNNNNNNNNNNTSNPPDSIVWPPTVSAIKTVLFTEEQEQEENEASSLLSDDVITSSVSLLEKAKPNLDKLDKENPQQIHNHKMWCACALFVCKKHHHKQTPSMDIMTLSQILKKFGIPVVDFFATMPTFLAETKMIMTHDDASDDNNNDDSNDNNSSSALHFPEAAHEDPFGTKELRQRFVVDIALSKKNRDLVHSLFASDARDALREFAWLLFLVVRVRAFGADTFVSIVDSFELMMATMAYLLAHATSTHLTDTAVTTLSRQSKPRIRRRTNSVNFNELTGELKCLFFLVQGWVPMFPVLSYVSVVSRPPTYLSILRLAEPRNWYR